jgi:hypothetical protein
MPPNSHEPVDEHTPRARDLERISHLLVPPSPTCWWCQTRPTTTGEHKFKRSDLARMMDDGSSIIWSDRGTSRREIRGASNVKRDRYGVLKFPKSLCEACNNKHSQPFDNAYDHFARFAERPLARIQPSVNFRRLYGADWNEPTLNLARYYAKHFGCRLVRSGVPVPQSLRDFLNGATDMPDAHLGLITTDTIHRNYGKGLYVSPDYALTDSAETRFEYCVLAAYVGPIGVRYHWQLDGIDDRSQFFHFPNPVINRFKTETDVFEGSRRRPGVCTTLLQRLEQLRQ